MQITKETYFASIRMFFYFGPFAVWAMLKIRFAGGWQRGRRVQRGHTGRFSKSLPSHFSRSTAAGIPGSVACRASIRFFAAPCAQCQEVSRPEFTLTHSIRSFVRAGKKRLERGQRAGFAVIFIPRLFAVLRFVFMITARRCCQLFATGQFWRDIIVFC